VYVLIATIGKGIGSTYQSGAERAAGSDSVAARRHAGNGDIPRCGRTAACGGCRWIAREHPGEALLYAAFFAVWLLYYGLVLSGRR